MDATETSQEEVARDQHCIFDTRCDRIGATSFDGTIAYGNLD